MAALDVDGVGSMPLGMDMSLDEAIAERRGLRVVADDYAAPADGGGAAQIQVGTRVYVGNLAWSVKWQELKDYFRSAGDVVHAKIMEERSGRSRGCGIVEFGTAEEAAYAIETLNDTELAGRPIQVREDREDRALAGKGGGGAKPPRKRAAAPAGDVVRVGRRVYVGNLSWSTEWQELKDFFGQAGTVVYADVMKEAGGRSKGCGIVEFEAPEEAARAIETLNDADLGGRPIQVREDREDRDLKGSGGRAPRAPPRKRTKSDEIRVGRRCYVANLSWGTSWQDLKDHFRSAGNVVHAKVMEERPGRSKGCGIVEFESADEAACAIETLNESELDGRPISVREDREDRDLR